MYDITKTKPTFILEEGKFSDDLQGVQILVQKTFPNSNNIETPPGSEESNGKYPLYVIWVS